jgi:transcriptional regulator with XRE-family HTH domain
MKDHYGILQHVGNRIREFRKIRGISQENFAFECQLDRTYISGIERGERNVSLLNLSTIASKLGVPLSRLFADIKTNTTANAQDVYRVNHNFKISCGFSVMAKDVTNAALATATQLV